MVIFGEPGVGKSALLEDAREQAGDMRVLSGRGVESEAQLPFAALHQIVRPVLEHIEQPAGAAGRRPERGARPGGGAEATTASSSRSPS